MLIQFYFWLNFENIGQFEWILIIVDEGVLVDYVEGCIVLNYLLDFLYVVVVEVNVLKDVYCCYMMIQNWLDNVYLLEIKWVVVMDYVIMEWVDGNLGFKVMMKYLFVYLDGEGVKGMMLLIVVVFNGIY